MALYVWDARLTEQWEPDFELGLFDKKAKAVKACQDYADNPDNIRAHGLNPVTHTLSWEHISATMSRAVAPNGRTHFYVTKRRVS